MLTPQELKALYKEEAAKREAAKDAEAFEAALKQVQVILEEITPEYVRSRFSDIQGESGIPLAGNTNQKLLQRVSQALKEKYGYKTAIRRDPYSDTVTSYDLYLVIE